MLAVALVKVSVFSFLRVMIMQISKIIFFKKELF